VTERNLMIGVSGIRGIVFDPMGPDTASDYASALATLLGRGRYVLGRDTRPSGVVLAPAVCSALASCGCDVLDTGVAPTPTIQMAVEHHRARGGIALTASHNPAEWNALKLISGKGTFLGTDDIERIKTIVSSGRYARAGHDGAGSVVTDGGAVERHIEALLALDYVDAEEIGGAGFKVAVDCINGAGSAAIPELLERLGCSVVTIDCDGSGRFARDPEPVTANLGRLCDAVKRSGADVGFAVDPDADRLSMVDEKGDAIGEEYSIVLCAELVLSKTAGTVVVNLSTTRAVEDVARGHDSRVVRSPIGEINVVESMKASGSPLGGEGNGGIILPALHYGRDSLAGIGLVLQLLAERKEKLSQVMTLFPRYAIVKEKASLKDIADINSLRARLSREFEGAAVNDEDGLRFDFGEGWLHIRKSGTEPVVRVIAEAGTEREARTLIDRCMQAMRK
jgi:phosphomannomutase